MVALDLCSLTLCCSGCWLHFICCSCTVHCIICWTIECGFPSIQTLTKNVLVMWKSIYFIGLFQGAGSSHPSKNMKAAHVSVFIPHSHCGRPQRQSPGGLAPSETPSYIPQQCMMGRDISRGKRNKLSHSHMVPHCQPFQPPTVRNFPWNSPPSDMTICTLHHHKEWDPYVGPSMFTLLSCFQWFMVMVYTLCPYDCIWPQHLTPFHDQDFPQCRWNSRISSDIHHTRFGKWKGSQWAT